MVRIGNVQALSRHPQDSQQSSDIKTPFRPLPDTLKTPSRPHQTPTRHLPDTLQTISIHPPDTHKTVTKDQTCRVIGSFLLLKAGWGLLPLSFLPSLQWENKVNYYSNQLRLSWVCKLEWRLTILFQYIYFSYILKRYFNLFNPFQ